MSHDVPIDSVLYLSDGCCCGDEINLDEANRINTLDQRDLFAEI